jgi:hypothetical protein
MMKELKKNKFTKLLSIGLACAGCALAVGSFTTAANAQDRDPFGQPTWAKPRTASTGGTGAVRPDKPKPVGPPPVVVVTAPAIEQRIAYYKNLRESAAANGLELPKVTSVLTLDELSVVGIFRTPRGYAAMVEAKPINLSYTIYPGEKFFDGQLVAIEENRLVFRKVTKMSNNKFSASVENKTLRQYTVEQEVNGTAPVQPSSPVKTEEPTTAVNTPNNPQVVMPAATVIVSPLDEMNRQPVEKPTTTKTAKEKVAKEKPAKKVKKPVKVADNKKVENQ